VSIFSHLGEVALPRALGNEVGSLRRYCDSLRLCAQCGRPAMLGVGCSAACGPVLVVYKESFDETTHSGGVADAVRSRRGRMRQG
jgi:hypothetical protein